MAARDTTDLILHGVNPTGKEIGRGAYGRVFEVDYQGTLCAAKEVHSVLLELSQAEGRRKITTDFLNECQIWSTIRHPCIVQFLGVYYPARDQYRLPAMVMEKMQHSLRGLVENYTNIPLNVKLSILDEVCLGLRYLHSRNPPIVHRDLTPNNILLGGHLEAKITDLGVAKVMQTDSKMTMTKIPGTPDFMPPEALAQKPVYGPSLDVFSYGGVALNVITQQWPKPTDKLLLNSDTDKWEVASEGTRRQTYLDMFTGGAAGLVPLVTSCLSDNPKKRPSVMEVSLEIKREKNVCSHQTSRDGMSPIVWWAEVSGQSSSQQQQVTSLTTQLEMTISNEELRGEVGVLKTENDGLKVEVDGLKVEVDGLKVENNGYKEENAQLRAENQRLKVTSLTTQLEEMTISNEELRGENGVLMTEIDGLKVENNGLKVEVDGLKVENSGLKVEVDGLTVEVDGLKVENSGLKVENSGLKVEVDGLTVEVDGLKVENSGLKVENSGLKVEVDGLTVEVDGLKVENNGFKVENSGLKVEVDGLTVEVDGLKVENSGLKVENSGLKVEVDGLTVEVDGLKVENNGFKVENSGLKVEVDGLTVEVDGLKVENSGLKVENSGLKVEVDGLKVENSGLKVENSGFKVEVDGLKVEVDGLKVENNGYKEENVQLRAENQRLKEKLVQSPTPDLFSGPVNIKWQHGAPAPVKGWDHTGVLCDGKAYIGGGWDNTFSPLCRIYVYNPVNNSWSPSPINTTYGFFAMTTLNNQLITAGGEDRSYKVTNKIFSLDGNHLKEYTRMITPRYYATAASHQGTLVITGGKDDQRRKLATTELFDSTTGQWYTTSDLPLPHYWLQSVIVDNTLYLLGGYNQDGNYSPAVFTAPLDTLSSHQLKWSSQQDTPWCCSAPVSIQGRHLLTVGGWKKTGSDYVYTSDIKMFNKVSHSWEAIGHIPSARSGPAVVSVADNKIVVVGGYDDKGQFTNTVWIGSCEPQ
ncbi:uncharacterized protein [Dysidea avara]|uniref:uncharacterized protein isoform X2 n=1 Tax=Dysidea avara TaxID=196820 RepID=UPI00332B6E0B